MELEKTLSKMIANKIYPDEYYLIQQTITDLENYELEKNSTFSVINGSVGYSSKK